MENYYYELRLEVDKAFQELFADLLLALTQEGIEEDEGVIIIRSQESLDDVIFGIHAYAQELETVLGQKVPFNISCEQKENIDWYQRYQDSVSPIDVSPFYIHPSWSEPKDGALNIIIDPALAFGSGHHATTFTCLQAIAQYVKQGDRVLDVGCGSGILSIAASKLGAKVSLCDTDEQALASAKENFQKNDANFDAAWIGSVGQSDLKQYDVVVANIIADVLVILAKDLKSVLKVGGILILSGILNKYEDKVCAKYHTLKLISRLPQDEWVTLVWMKEE